MGNKKATDKSLIHRRLPASVSPVYLIYMQIVAHSR